MTAFDVFIGDADGLCSLHELLHHQKSLVWFTTVLRSDGSRARAATFDADQPGRSRAGVA